MNHLFNHSVNNQPAIQTFSRRSWVIPTNHALAPEKRELSHTLLGFFKDEANFSKEFVQEKVNELWITNGPVQVEKLGNLFSFKFTYHEDKDYVEKFGLKNINGALLLTDYWTPNHNLEDFKITEAVFWIELRRLPLEYFEDKTLVDNLLSTIGEKVYVEWNSESVAAKQSIWAQVWLPINAPFVPGAWINTVEGQETWITFSYANLFKFCYHCGIPGHYNGNCRTPTSRAIQAICDRFNFYPTDNHYRWYIDFDRPLYTSDI